MSMVYRRSLTDFRFGLLYDELRTKQGLVYNISIDNDFNSNHFDISYSSNEADSMIVTEQIKISLENYEKYIKSNLNYIKDRLMMEFELDWGNIQETALETIDRVVSGGITYTPAILVSKINQVTVDDLLKVNGYILKKFNESALLIR